MLSNDLVSILIPAYNHEKYVGQALESVLAQTYEPIELLVLDDGSADRTWEAILALEPACEKRFRRVVFNRCQKNMGLVAALNRLLAEAAGAYIVGLASDDLMAPSLVEEALSFLQSQSDYGAVTFDAGLIDAESRPVFWDRDRETVLDLSQAQYRTMADYLRRQRSDVDFLSDDFGKYESLLRGNYIPSSPVYHRSLLNKTGLYLAEAPLEDWHMALQMAKHTRLKFIDRPLFSYRWHSSNTARQKEKMRAMTRATLLHEIDRAIKTNDRASLEAIRRCFCRVRTIWDGNLISLRKIRNFEEKKMALKIGSKEFVLTYKKGLTIQP
jgi:alpha-1,3-rhamnosyltransferase